MNFSLDILYYYEREGWDSLYKITLYYTLQNVTIELSVLFLELAIMLNISKWVYFFLVILTHRKIRYDEIFAEMMYESEDNSKE